MRGSPSACLNSSLISCFVIRSSLRQWKRAQTRSSATSTIVAILIADTSRIAAVRISSGTAFGSPNNAFTATASSARNTIITTMLMARNLKTDFANSMRPWPPNILPHPWVIEIRENSGLILSNTIRGTFCKNDDARPASASTMTIGSTNRAALTPTATRNSMASALVRMRKPDGSSIIRARARRQIPYAINCEKALDNQQRDHRCEDRRFTRDGNLALLDGITNLLFRRLFGFTFLVGCLGHCRRSLGEDRLVCPDPD